MTQFVTTDVDVVINGVNLSDHGVSAELTYDADAVENTSFGDDTHVHLGGLKNVSVSLEFGQDYDAAKVDATLFPLVGTSFVVVLKPVSGAVSATNPSFTLTGLLTSYNPIAGAVGDHARAPATIVPASGSLVRATS